MLYVLCVYVDGIDTGGLCVFQRGQKGYRVEEVDDGNSLGGNSDLLSDATFPYSPVIS